MDASSPSTSSSSPSSSPSPVSSSSSISSSPSSSALSSPSSSSFYIRFLLCSLSTVFGLLLLSNTYNKHKRANKTNNHNENKNNINNTNSHNSNSNNNNTNNDDDNECRNLSSLFSPIIVESGGDHINKDDNDNNNDNDKNLDFDGSSTSSWNFRLLPPTPRPSHHPHQSSSSSAPSSSSSLSSSSLSAKLTNSSIHCSSSNSKSSSVASSVNSSPTLRTHNRALSALSALPHQHQHPPHQAQAQAQAHQQHQQQQQQQQQHLALPPSLHRRASISSSSSFIIALKELFESIDEDKDHHINYMQFTHHLTKLGLKSDSIRSLQSVLCFPSPVFSLSPSPAPLPSPTSFSSFVTTSFDFNSFLAKFQAVIRSQQHLNPNQNVHKTTNHYNNYINRKNVHNSYARTNNEFVSPHSTPHSHSHSPVSPSFAADVDSSSSSSSSSSSLRSSSPSFASHAPPAHAPPCSHIRINVFLGGSCGSTAWRSRVAEPLLNAFNISSYNPQVDTWNQHLVPIENIMKQWCETSLFVISRKTRSIASMLETAALIAEGRSIVIVIQNVSGDTDVDGQRLTPSEVSDLNRARYYLRDMCLTRSIPVFDTVRQACQYVKEIYSPSSPEPEPEPEPELDHEHEHEHEHNLDHDQEQEQVQEQDLPSSSSSSSSSSSEQFNR